MLEMYGRTTRAASVGPTKMFAADAKLSAPDVFMIFCMTNAKSFVTHCMTPK